MRERLKAKKKKITVEKKTTKHKARVEFIEKVEHGYPIRKTSLLFYSLVPSLRVIIITLYFKRDRFFFLSSLFHSVT